MTRKRLLWSILLILIGGTIWSGYRAVHQSALNHALIVASAKGDPWPVRALLAEGADPNAGEEETPELGWRHLLHLFGRHKQNVSYVYPLTQAMTADPLDANHLLITQTLLEHHASPNVNLADGTPLPLWAVRDDQRDKLLSLLLRYGANPNTADKAGVSLLMDAVDAHDLSLVRELLDQGATPNRANAHGDTPLMWAAYYCDLQATKLLLSRGADVNSKDKNGETALQYVAVSSQGTRFVATKLLLAAGADVNAQDRYGCSPFLDSLMYMKRNDINIMMTHGADVRKAIPLSAVTNSITVDIHSQISNTSYEGTGPAFPGMTPLMFAVQSRDTDLVRKMLANGADANVRNAQGKTALDFGGDNPTIRALLHRAGAHR